MNFNFYDIVKECENVDINVHFESVNRNSIEHILSKDKCSKYDFLSLLSPKALNDLESVAQKSNELTVRHFGRTVLLYAPVYISNYCENKCIYCGFNKNNSIQRKQLDFMEIEREAEKIAESGINHILLLTGSDKSIANISYIENAVEILKKYFSSVSIEVYPMEVEEYKRLVDKGVDGVCLYQETYDEKLYSKIHLGGPKRNYMYRLNAPERACLAGVRTINIGSLLGLKDWREEIFTTGLHAEYLQNKYSDAEVSLSFPRLRPQAGGFSSGIQVDDISMVQMMLAYRIFMPRGGITISTREASVFRDNVLPLGVTKMSAGSKTIVGGYSGDCSDDGQFEISDDRSVKEIEKMIYTKGFQPVFKDWHCLV
jgi:2-iminoacetate synthase